ncbi:hypothetical protein M427DRAFT_65275 [Gonapodya prolifera JEL478]|uniref:Uncharacterized protein n=1 Tax=Gonapodya prolifera (strain JEL478) TaxID=1344416 RepID=A0A139B0B1_GONPJ|nr:hypothetical protein M427DRAFT_65275 [Gonapodya prolifera JEL478]|eukprot:KXS22243.1 hypothetical protein M427DRAFT_65275 [Gonapodya prolifera JEL478]
MAAIRRDPSYPHLITSRSRSPRIYADVREVMDAPVWKSAEPEVAPVATAVAWVPNDQPAAIPTSAVSWAVPNNNQPAPIRSAVAWPALGNPEPAMPNAAAAWASPGPMPNAAAAWAPFPSYGSAPMPNVAVAWADPGYPRPPRPMSSSVAWAAPYYSRSASLNPAVAVGLVSAGAVLGAVLVLLVFLFVKRRERRIRNEGYDQLYGGLGGPAPVIVIMDGGNLPPPYEKLIKTAVAAVPRGESKLEGDQE